MNFHVETRVGKLEGFTLEESWREHWISADRQPITQEVEASRLASRIYKTYRIDVRIVDSKGNVIEEIS